MSNEIERKWLLKGFPFGLKELQAACIDQGYLSVLPEVRIRREYIFCPNLGVNYTLTIKGDGALKRPETEILISEKQYIELVNIVPGRLITKNYRQYALDDNLILECSLVDDGLPTSFYYAEVEFKSEKDANLFVLPFDAEEITFNSDYKMKNYWARTRIGGIK